MIGAPPIVVADEPTSALDTDTQDAFLALLFAELDHQEASLLMVSHDRGPGPFDRSCGWRRSHRPAGLMLWRLAWRSLANRRMTALLTVLAVAASVALLLSASKVRSGARDSFAGTISGTDLIVGARAGDVQLLLYARVPDRQRHRQPDLEKLPGHRRPARGRLDRADLARRQPQRLSRAGHQQRLLPTATGVGSRSFAAGGPFQDLFDRWWAPTWPSGWATRSAIRSWSAMASATCRSPTMPTSRSGSQASWPRPAHL